MVGVASNATNYIQLPIWKLCGGAVYDPAGEHKSNLWQIYRSSQLSWLYPHIGLGLIAKMKNKQTGVPFRATYDDPGAVLFFAVQFSMENHP